MGSDIIFINLWTTTEFKLGAISGTIWATLDLALGGIDTPIKALAILITLDFITGVTAGYKNNELSSSKGTKGLWKKAGVFFCVFIACLLDMCIGTEVFRGMTISGFALIEAMSLIENLDRMGWGYIIPNFLRVRLKQIADEKVMKGDKK